VLPDGRKPYRASSRVLRGRGDPPCADARAGRLLWSRVPGDPVRDGALRRTAGTPGHGYRATPCAPGCGPWLSPGTAARRAPARRHGPVSS